MSGWSCSGWGPAATRVRLQLQYGLSIGRCGCVSRDLARPKSGGRAVGSAEGQQAGQEADQMVHLRVERAYRNLVTATRVSLQLQQGFSIGFSIGHCGCKSEPEVVISPTNVSLSGPVAVGESSVILLTTPLRPY